MSANFRRKGRRTPTIVGVRKLVRLPFRVYQNICSTLFSLVTKHACDRRMDGRRDGQNYDSQDRAGIAASHGKTPALYLQVTDLGTRVTKFAPHLHLT